MLDLAVHHIWPVGELAEHQSVLAVFYREDCGQRGAEGAGDGCEK